MEHEIGAEERITYGRNDRFTGGPVGGGRFWLDENGSPAAKIGGPEEWNGRGMIDVRAGDTFSVGGQTWRITDIVDADSDEAYLKAVRVG